MCHKTSFIHSLGLCGKELIHEKTVDLPKLEVFGDNKVDKDVWICTRENKNIREEKTLVTSIFSILHDEFIKVSFPGLLKHRCMW